jgi:ubiquinone/menaquinone biosynthesis C-methylase UbiE
MFHDQDQEKTLVFNKTSQYYDLIYSYKDYRKEAKSLVAIINKNLLSGGNRLLDVACGTGHHIMYMTEHYETEGIDLSEEMLMIARRRTPNVAYHHADMIDFNLHRKYDIVTCLFSSIGYVKTMDNLKKALTCMADHLVPGGVLLIEPWFTPKAWVPGTVHANFVDEPDLKIARVSTSLVKGRISFFDFHYLLGTPEGTEHFIERHELGLFKAEEMWAAITEVGLEVTFDKKGLTDRGLYIGCKPL